MRIIAQILIPLVILGVVGGGVASMIANRPEPPKKPVQISEVFVSVQPAERRTVTFKVETQGTVSPRTETTLIPQISGKVNWISDNLIAGGFFEKDELLVEVDDRDYIDAIARAEANLAAQTLALEQEKARAEQALKDWESLGGNGNPPSALTLRKPQLNQAEAAVMSAKADLATAQRNLERTKIRAPYDGMVRMKMADIGQFVSPGTPLASVFAVDYVEVRLPLTLDEVAYLNLPESFSDSRSTNRNQPPVILSARFGGVDQIWEGRIVRTEGTIDTSSRVVHAIARVENPYERTADNRPPLKVGMFVSAKIEGITMKDLVVLPRHAMRGSNQILIVDEEQKLRQREVEIVRAGSREVFISKGVSEGENICLTALEFVVEGMSVKIAGQDEPAKEIASLEGNTP